MLLVDVLRDYRAGRMWFQQPDCKEPAEHVERLDMAVSTLDETVAFEITNIWKYLRGVKSRPLTIQAPLAPTMWFEFREDDGNRIGIYLWAADVHEMRTVAGVYSIPDDHLPSGDGWQAIAFLFWKPVGGWNATILPALVSWEIGRDGTAHDEALIHPLTENRESFAVAEEMITDYVGAAFYALTFAHCRNVAVVDYPPSMLVRRAAERRGDPLITYKTLMIDPSHAVVKHEQDRARRGEVTPKALHIVRGHFATYSEDKPLFGKYSGRYFIPMHTRGSLKAGAVVKDYEVKAGVG